MYVYKYKMFWKDPKISKVIQIVLLVLMIIYSTHWIYISSDSLWSKSVGSYNIIYLSFLIFFSFISLVLLLKNSAKWYIISTVVTLIPAVIVCFINRYSRYPDFASIVTQYSTTATEQAIIDYAAMYSEDWKMYDFIASRSGRSSTVISFLTGFWSFLVVFPFIN